MGLALTMRDADGKLHLHTRLLNQIQVNAAGRNRQRLFSHSFLRRAIGSDSSPMASLRSFAVEGRLNTAGRKTMSVPGGKVQY
jgi:hypothetical protein